MRIQGVPEVDLGIARTGYLAFWTVTLSYEKSFLNGGKVRWGITHTGQYQSLSVKFFKLRNGNTEYTGQLSRLGTRPINV